MKQSLLDRDRRNILKLALSSAAVAPLSSLLLHSPALAGDLPPVSEDEPAAKGLGYVHDAAKTNDPKRKGNQLCKNCNLIQSKEGEWRPCSIFPGKAVNENGWCKAWVGRI